MPHSIAPLMTVKQSTNVFRYAEVWEPMAGGSRLQLSASSTLDPDSGDITIPDAGETLEIGEGISGSAAKQSDAVILQDECVALNTARSRSGCDLTALVAIPVFDIGRLVSVVVFGLGEGFGGLEIWRPDERHELSIQGSYYRGLSSFEYMSQYVRFPLGSGLPGACWSHSKPRIVDAPATNGEFIRSFSKDPANLSSCCGLPIGWETGNSGSVLLMLSAEQKPLARFIDVVNISSKRPTDDLPKPILHCEERKASPPGFAQRSWPESLMTKVAEERCAMLVNTADHGLKIEAEKLVVIPFFNQGRITQLTGFWF